MRRRFLIYVSIAVPAILFASELTVQLLDPATSDERAVLWAAKGSLSPPDCEPTKTSVIVRQPKPQGWVEVEENESRQLDELSLQAKPRAIALATYPGWLMPTLGGAFDRGKCAHRISLSTPAIVGDKAFVTIASDVGISRNVFVKKSDRWLFHSSEWDGEPNIQY